ncbi:extracellular solute-binding protein [Paenibacillus sp. MABNR03]|uniref:extracellular solute-binding protein n=1 Tax=Paenibacillus sp. MABNR03 TaxID=3142626 RepID=UPI003D27BDC9
MKFRYAKLIALTICGSLLLSACGGENAEPQTNADGKPIISWLNILHSASPPTDTVLSKIEEITNTDIQFSWIPDASKEERLNTSLASGSLADIVSITIMENSSVRNALKAGVFWEVGPYLDEFPNLKEISADMRNSASIDGKLYGIPMQKQVARNGVIIRKDWLDKLGLPVPKTTAELMEAAKAFTEQDPDGNGSKDTTGFIDRSDLVFGAFKTLGSYFGTPSGWAVSGDGKVTPEFESEGYVKAMDYMKELYNNGYINQDFAVTAKKDQQEGFAQGKAGIYVGALFDSKNLLNLAKGVQDDMDLIMVNDITSTGNESDRAIWSTSNGVGGLLAFPKSEVKDEAELKQVLKFMDDLMSEEVYTLMTYGIEGVHYSLEGNAATITDTKLWEQEVQPFSSSRPNENGYDIHDSDPLRVESDRLIQENTKYAVLNPMYSLESATFSEQGSELQKIITDATYKYILGKLDLQGFQDAVQTWRKSGGDKMITEYEAAYQAVQNK